MASMKNQKPLTQKQFRERLNEELTVLVSADVPSSPHPTKKRLGIYQGPLLQTALKEGVSA